MITPTAPMGFDSSSRYSSKTTIDIPRQYYSHKRNNPLTIPNSKRSNPRGYTMGGLVESPPRDDNTHVVHTQSRRRIAVACARCRKRKIRCSGDAGNGFGCANCRSAGLDPNQCQFHRVGSDHVTRVLEQQEHQRFHPTNNFIDMGNPHLGMASYPRNGGLSYSHGMLGRSPSDWTSPYSGEVSSLETYNLDQPTAYLSHNAMMTNPSISGGSYRWSHDSGKAFQPEVHPYMGQIAIPVFSTPEIPYLKTEYIKTEDGASTSSESVSPLSMASLRQNLPCPQRQAKREPNSTIQQRRLPIPLPSPALTLRNDPDRVHDGRLRSLQTMRSSPLPTGSAFSRPPLPFTSDGDIPVAAHVGTSTSDLEVQGTAATPLPNTTESAMVYLNATTTVSEDSVTSSATVPPQMNFSTSPLLQMMTPTSTVAPTYSNFRNYELPMSSSNEAMSTLAHPNEQTSLYSFSPDVSSKRHSAGGTSNGSVLVSGHRYTPFDHNPTNPQPQSNLENLCTDSFDTRHGIVHRNSVPSLNRGL